MNFTKVIAAPLLVFLYTIAIAPSAAFAAQETCPKEGKVESVVDGDLDNIVLEEGTLVCIKGGQTLVNIVADGSSLAKLLGTGQNVSHYTVLKLPTTTTTTSIPTTTSTTAPSTTTTSIPETTSTSTVPSTSTTIVKETTTSVAESTTTTNEEETTTSAPPSTSSSEGESEEESEEVGETLPFTGMDNPLALLGLASMLLASGGLLIRKTLHHNA